MSTKNHIYMKNILRFSSLIALFSLSIFQVKYGYADKTVPTNQDNQPATKVVDPNSTNCGYKVSHEERLELMDQGFVFKDANHIGLNLFSKLNYVYSDNIYAKHFNGEIWRIVYLGQPVILRDYVGKTSTCGLAYGYSVKNDGGVLSPVKLGSIKFLNNYTP